MPRCCNHCSTCMILLFTLHIAKVLNVVRAANVKEPVQYLQVASFCCVVVDGLVHWGLCSMQPLAQLQVVALSCFQHEYNRKLYTLLLLQPLQDAHKTVLSSSLSSCAVQHTTMLIQPLQLLQIASFSSLITHFKVPGTALM
jgi:hypothetical protein